MQNHDRYLIYHLLGHAVDIQLSAHEGGHRLQGIVEKVWRDIFDGVVRVKVSGREHEFREPEAIVMTDDGVDFLYGDVEVEDEGVMPTYNAYSESVHGYLTRTERRPVHRTEFRIGQLELEPHARWRTRVAI